MLILDSLVDQPDKVVDGNFVRPNVGMKPCILVCNDTDVDVLIKNLEATVRKLKENLEAVLFQAQMIASSQFSLQKLRTSG